MSNSSNSLVIFTAVALVAGLAGGYLLASSLGHNIPDHPDQSSVPAAVQPVATTDTLAADLRVVLNALMRQHVNLAAAALRNGFDASPSYNASVQSLDQNSQEIGAAIGKIYGSEAGDNFLASWRAHIGFFVDYTVALKKHDQSAAAKAVDNLNAYVDGVANFLAKANPNLPEPVVKQVVAEHVRLLKATIDEYASKNFAKSYGNQAAADQQIGGIGDAISGAIVKQFPEKF